VPLQGLPVQERREKATKRVSAPPANGGGDGAEPRGGDAVLEFSALVGGADEDGVGGYGTPFISSIHWETRLRISSRIARVPASFSSWPPWRADGSGKPQ